MNPDAPDRAVGAARAAEPLALDVLALAPHPDDAELFCGGLLARLVGLGYRVGVTDLTRGERASRGTPAQRLREAEAAARVLGLAYRGNLGLADGGLRGDDPEQRQAIVAELRRLRPQLLLAPWREERHPDHRAAGLLAESAAFLAGLANYPAPGQLAHRVLQVLFYPQRVEARPSFVVDIADVAAQKARAIACHASQVAAAPSAAPTDAPLIGSALALAALQARDAYFGAQVGSTAGEPYVCAEAVPVADPLALFRARRGPAHVFPGAA